MNVGPNSYTFHTREGSLMWRLADYSDLIQRNNNNTITVLDQIQTQYDSNGILDRRALLQGIMGSVATEYHWQGSYTGPHHLMWPRRAYLQPKNTNVRADIATQYRASPTLQIILPRELHDYLHRITEPPTMPDIDVMEQYNLEQSQVSRLFSVINHTSYRTLPITDTEREALRQRVFLDRLNTMQDGSLGLMPSIETLATQPLSESRRQLRHLARPLGISAHSACQQVFFADWHTP